MASGDHHRIFTGMALGLLAIGLVTTPQGLLDPAVSPTATVPGAPTIGTATPGKEQATVSWTAPASNGGSEITGYLITPFIGYDEQPSTRVSSAPTTQTVIGLSGGIRYRFRVKAINAVGNGIYSKASAVISVLGNSATAPETTAGADLTPPAAPTIGAATAGEASATVSWTAPNSDGGSTITGYAVTPYQGLSAETPRTFATTDTTQTIVGLTAGSAYRFRVQAINGIGTGPYSQTSAEVTPAAVADAKGEVIVERGDSFWTLAAGVVEEKLGSEPTNRVIADYWLILIEANRDRLVHPNNPDLIYPGQTLVLPPAGI